MSSFSTSDLYIESALNDSYVNESISVFISFDENYTSDVKIFILDSNNKTISETLFEDGWKSSVYYIKSSWPKYNTFYVRAKSYTSDSSLCIRLRKSGGTKFYEACKPINILQNKIHSEYVSSDNAANINENSSYIESSIESDINNISSEYKYDEYIPFVYNSSLSQIQSENSTIYLNNSVQNISTRYSKTRVAMLYGFSLLCIILLVLISLRKI